jgi:hypothetical protein
MSAQDWISVGYLALATVQWAYSAWRDSKREIEVKDEKDWPDPPEAAAA